MKNLITLILSLLLSSAIGQSLELSGGVSHNDFFETRQFFEPSPTRTNYEGGLGHAARIGIKFDLPKLNSPVPLSIKFNLGYSTYNARYRLALLTFPSIVFKTADVQKSTINLGFYPINVLLMDKLQISLGGELNVKIKGNIQDELSHISSFRCTTGSLCIEDLTHRNVTFRVNSQISYLIPLSPMLALVPQYQFSMGLLEEFDGNSVNTKTMHNTFWIGLERKLP